MKPNREPDFTLQVTGQYQAGIWQLEDVYMVELPLKDGYISFVEHGNYLTKKSELLDTEIRFTIMYYLLKRYA